MKPIVYLSKSEIDSFASSGISECFGYCYEWEGEGVMHVHLAPLRHAFGLCTKIHFIKFNQLPAAINEPIVALFPDEEVKAFINWGHEVVEAEVIFIPKYDELYSRSKGILEVSALKNNKIVIIGLGSFGSQISIELAKAGIENFSLFDFDRVELHNFPY